MIFVYSFASFISKSVISRENRLIWRLSSIRGFIFLMKTLLVARVGALIRRGRLKEGGVHKLFLILEGGFIRERRLLKDLPYIFTYLRQSVISFYKIVS